MESNVIEISAKYENTSSDPISDFSVQVAVPKFMQLKLSSASSNLLTTGVAITQNMEVVNNQQGQKALAMRLKITGKIRGQLVTDMTEVRNFPEGL